jgi:peptidoglycan hydrolase-like protein with peptidoglycan-binding domain
MGNNRVRVRVSDRLGNTRTVTLPIKRHISLSKPWLNKDARRTLGYSADATTIRQVFRFVGYTEPWYAFAQKSHPLITEVQHRLRILGTAPTLQTTGRLDVPTLLAIRKFQRQNKIEDIATVGPKTRKALDKQLDRHLQKQG